VPTRTACLTGAGSRPRATAKLETQGSNLDQQDQNLPCCRITPVSIGYVGEVGVEPTTARFLGPAALPVGRTRPGLSNDLPPALGPAFDQQQVRLHRPPYLGFHVAAVLPHFAVQPGPELAALRHPPERLALVQQLRSFLAADPHGSGSPVGDPDAGVAVVLVLAALAAGLEGLDVAVSEGDREQELAVRLVSSITAHGGHRTVVRREGHDPPQPWVRARCTACLC
jgi:hypothetical protein